MDSWSALLTGALAEDSARAVFAISRALESHRPPATRASVPPRCAGSKPGSQCASPKQPVAGFPAWWIDRSGAGAWAPDPSLLTGAAGTALALLAGLTDQEPTWDRLFLLSARGGFPPRAR
jgi:hypothetical protein